jgi:hypothetical protein
MPQSTSSTAPSQLSLTKRILIGAGIGLLLISLFLHGVKIPDPEWGKFWMIRPLIIVPLAGAMGGLCHYFIMHYHNQFGLHKIIAIALSLVVFVMGLWIGFVLGLDGTLWN